VQRGHGELRLPCGVEVTGRAWSPSPIGVRVCWAENWLPCSRCSQKLLGLFLAAGVAVRSLCRVFT
jgi:hypothetical protein